MNKAQCKLCGRARKRPGICSSCEKSQTNRKIRDLPKNSLAVNKPTAKLLNAILALAHAGPGAQ